MSVLVLGGDQIIQIRKILEEYGATKIKHWDLRNKATATRKDIPSGVDYVVMLTSFINHNAMKYFKSQAKKRNLMVIPAQRNIQSLQCELEKRFDNGCFDCPVSGKCN